MELSKTTSPSSIKELFQETKPEQASEEIQFKGNQYVKSGVKSSSNIFGFFKALFRTAADRESNQRTITQARTEIVNIFGKNSGVIKQFDAAFNSKLSSGSPLTKGALMQFKGSLSSNDQEILEGKRLSLVEQSQSDAMLCFNNAKGLADPKAKALGDPKVTKLGDSLEISYWKKAGQSYEHQSEALARGDKKEAAKCQRIAQGYHAAAVAYGADKKDLAHYLVEDTEFYKAGKIALEQDEKVEASQFRELQSYYSAAIEAEESNKPDVAQYWSKAAKCLDAAYRADWNHRQQDAQDLMEAVRIYSNAATLASEGEEDSAATMTKKADIVCAAVFRDYVQR